MGHRIKFLQSFLFKKFPILALLVLSIGLSLAQVPSSSVNWNQLISSNGVRFSARNGHAACVFKQKLWVVGGRTASYTDYNLQTNDKMADVWHSVDGATWVQVSTLDGDFYAQNIDVVQPGSIAPWYNRFGHTLNAVDINGDGEDDIMVLAGGYSPSPGNDVWVTEDGIIWMFAGNAPWSARAWHGTTIFKGKLYLMGGSPLNNEIWRLNNATKYFRTQDPLTRSHFTNETYYLSWEFLGNASWSPRVGMGLVTQWFFNVSHGQTYEEAKERMVLLGGYGGWLDGVDGSLYDGYSCRNDVWQTYDGANWTYLTSPPRISVRAWMAMTVSIGQDPRHDPAYNTTPPKIYLFGGGYVGFKTGSTKKVVSMVGRPDAYWSYDAINWTEISYQEGGGSTRFTFYSSQEWTKTVVDTATKYLGMWGHTVTQFNTSSTDGTANGKLYLIGGLYAGGDYTNNVWESASGVICDIDGIACNGHGTCGSDGCVCYTGWVGKYCDTYVGGNVVSGGLRMKYFPRLLLVGITVLISTYNLKFGY